MKSERERERAARSTLHYYTIPGTLLLLRYYTLQLYYAIILLIVF